MAKSLTPAQAKELEELRAESSAILRYLDDSGVLAAAEQFHAAVRKAYDQRNLRGLRAAHADLSERARRLSVEERRVLAGYLAAEGAIQDPVASSNRKVADVLARGKVESAEEYRLLLAVVDEIHDDPSRAAEIDALNNLLADAHDHGLSE